MTIDEYIYSIYEYSPTLWLLIFMIMIKVAITYLSFRGSPSFKIWDWLAYALMMVFLFAASINTLVLSDALRGPGAISVYYTTYPINFTGMVTQLWLIESFFFLGFYPVCLAWKIYKSSKVKN